MKEVVNVSTNTPHYVFVLVPSRVENTNKTHIHFSTGILNGQSKLSELPVTHFQSTIVTIDVAVFSMRINAYHRVNIIGVI